MVGSAAKPLTFRLPVRVLIRSFCCTAWTMPPAWTWTVGFAADIFTTSAAAVAFCRVDESLRTLRSLVMVRCQELHSKTWLRSVLYGVCTS